MTKEQFIKAVQPKMYEAAMLALSGHYTPEEHAGYVKRLQEMRKAKAAALAQEPDDYGPLCEHFMDIYNRLNIGHGTGRDNKRESLQK
ncbi:MAG: hypothetical protein IJV28_03755 [Paludibacteraceae bacterium]|nr:hypothetical protein [Paludibacteraceae bacterium]